MSRICLVEVLAGELFIESVDIIAEVRMPIGVGPGGEVHQVNRQLLFQRNVLLAARSNAVENGLAVPLGAVAE